MLYMNLYLNIIFFPLLVITVVGWIACVRSILRHNRPHVGSWFQPDDAGCKGLHCKLYLIFLLCAPLATFLGNMGNHRVSKKAIPICRVTLCCIVRLPIAHMLTDQARRANQVLHLDSRHPESDDRQLGQDRQGLALL